MAASQRSLRQGGQRRVGSSVIKNAMLTFLAATFVGCLANTNDGKCDTIALGTAASSLPLTPNAPGAASIGPSRGRVNVDCDAGTYRCGYSVGAPYSGTCHDQNGEGGAWVCQVWVEDGGVVGVGTDCYN